MPADLRPTDLWTLRTADNHLVRATLIPQGKVLILASFIHDRPEGAEDFQDSAAALRRAGQLRPAFEGEAWGEDQLGVRVTRKPLPLREQQTPHQVCWLWAEA